jgi:hypothetical protein
MRSHSPIRSRSLVTLAAMLALLATLGFAPATRAATTGDVEVTADINTFVTSLELTLCDPTADFGSGLNAFGDPVSGTTDTVQNISKTFGQPDGAFYQWFPSCQSGKQFFEVVSNVSWSSTVCATAGTYTSDLTMTDLRYYPSTTGVSYGQVPINASNFPACDGSQPVWTSGSPGTTSLPMSYFLQIDPGDAPGSFAATTTWEITSG